MADGSIIIDTQVDSQGLSEGLSKLGSFAAGGLKVAAGAITALSAALGAAGMAAINTGMKFDSAMSQVAATMGLSVDQISGLRQVAIDLGADTAFSATEAAQALNYLALAGYDAQTAAGVLPAVLDLAAAGSLDLAYASDLATDAMAALGIAATGENLTAFGDILAKAASSANTSVAQLGEAILTVGGTAKMLSGGTTELATVIGVLANRGIKASQAGTNLRNILLALTAPTDKAQKALYSLGVSTVDSSGNLRQMQDIFSDLSVSMEGMSDSAKQQVLSEIFNRYDLAAAQALLAGCNEEWSELQDKINDADGAMSEMAKTQLDNLAGDVEQLHGALESLGISIYDGVLPQLRELTQLGTAMIDQLTAAMQEGGFQGLANALGDVLAQAVTHITGYAPGLIALASDVINSLINGLKKNSSKIARGVASVITNAFSGIAGMLPGLVDAGISIAFELISALAGALPELVPQAVEALVQSLVSLLSNVDGLVNVGRDIVVGLVQGIINSAPALMQGIGDLFSTLFGEAIDLLELLNWSNIANFIKSALGGLGNWLSGVFSAGKSLVEGLDWSTVSGKISGSFDGIASAISQAFSKGKDEASAITWADVGESVKAGVMTALDAGGAFLTAGFTAGKAAIEAIDWGTLGTTIGGAFNGLVDASGEFLSGAFTVAHAAIQGIDWSQLGQSISNTFNNLVDVSGEFLSGAFVAAHSTIAGINWAGIGENISAAFNGIIDVTGEFISCGFTAAHSTINSIDWVSLGEVIAAPFNGLIDVTGAFISGGFTAAEATINGIDWAGIGATISGAFNNLVDTTGEFISKGFTTAAAVIQGIDWNKIGSDVASGLNNAWSLISGFGALLFGIGDTALDAGQSGIDAIRKWLGLDAAEGEAAAGTAEGQALAKGIVSGFTGTLDSFGQAGTDAATAVITAVVTAFEVKKEEATTAFKEVGETLPESFAEIATQVYTQATSLYTAITTLLSAENGLLIGTQCITGIAQGITDTISVALSAATKLSTSTINTFRSYLSYNAGVGIGQNIAAGIAKGIKNGESKVINAVIQLAKAALFAIRDKLGIHSPSTAFAELGVYCTEGLAKGLMDSSGEFVNAYQGLIDGARQYASSGIVLEAAAQKMQFAVENKTSFPPDKLSVLAENRIDYRELAIAIWEEMPEDFAVNQTVNFNKPVDTPDETARALRKQNTQGLAGGKS